jgi:RNase P subunit RPR2
MKLPPYAKANTCAECRAAIYVPGYEIEVPTMGGRTRRELRPLDRPPEGVPAVMSACRCAWLRRAVSRGAEVVAA